VAARTATGYDRGSSRGTRGSIRRKQCVLVRKLPCSQCYLCVAGDLCVAVHCTVGAVQRVRGVLDYLPETTAMLMPRVLAELILKRGLIENNIIWGEDRTCR
jgi:hypothetical protein